MIQCADPLLLSGSYTYTDSKGTYCSGLNTSLVDSCSNNLTTVQFNDSLVSDNNCSALSPGWSGKAPFLTIVVIYLFPYWLSLLDTGIRSLNMLCFVSLHALKKYQNVE